ncbi:MAG: cell division protein FtsA [Thermoanaerobaculaceae bacterium]|nr:cell division protein FtsA [Thermoanaerobaculaceae bacterium]TAM48103.1 MAG: cell division protein FtsA [Acidobacteriota bacterium]
MAQGPRVLAALDVGNYRVLALIAELSESDEMVIRGVGLAPSSGMRSGQVVQMKPVAAAIKAAAEEAELMAKLPAEKVVASVAGIFISGRLTRAAISMGARQREVTMADLETLHDAVRRQPLPAGHTVLNVVSPTYALDDQDGLLDPQAMVGRQLAVDAYVLTCQESPVRTIEKAINEAGLAVEEFLFAPVAAADATLTADERRLGAIVIDIGYGTTSYAAYSGDKLLASGSFPIGGNKINDDLVHRFQTTAAGAEKAKREAGTMLLGDVGEEETISVPTIEGRGTHVISRRELCKTIRLRMQETFELIAAEVWRQIPQDAPCTGVVLSGGGAHLEGLAALAEEVFVKRARLGDLEGVPDATHLLASSELPARSPAVAVGLLVHGRSLLLPAAVPQVRERRHREGLWTRISRKVLAKRGGGL